MKRIILTEQEVEVIQLELNKQIDIWSEPEKLSIICSIVERAKALMHKLDASEELNGNLLLWYWNKYQEQQNNF